MHDGTLRCMWMIQKLCAVLLELAPTVAMIVVLPAYGFETAVLALVVATVLTVPLVYVLERRVPKFGLFGAVGVVVFGLLTVFSSDATYILVLDTLGAVGFALLLVVSRARGVLLLKEFFSPYFAITDTGWNILTTRWSVFFVFVAGVNEYVRLVYTPEQWVVWNGVALVAGLVFGTYQFTLSKRERLADASPWGLRRL